MVVTLIILVSVETTTTKSVYLCIITQKATFWVRLSSHCQTNLKLSEVSFLFRRSKTSLHHRPAPHFMMYRVAMTPKFVQTLKKSMIGSRPSFSSKSMTASRPIHVPTTRSMHIDRRVSESMGDSWVRVHQQI